MPSAPSVGHNRLVMIGLLVLGFPFLLLAFMLFMQKVEEPLSRVAVERKVERFLDQADAEDMETFVREGTDSALRRFADRRLRRLRPGARRREARSRPGPTVR